MNLRIIIILGFLLLNLKGFNQSLDYLSIRDSITSLSCAKTDSATVVQALQRLTEIDSNSIDSHLNLYLTDLANVYWINAARTKDTSYNHLSIKVNLQLIRLEPENFSAWWNLGYQYVKLEECELAIKAMNQYLKFAPKESIEALNPGGVFKKCL